MQSCKIMQPQKCRKWQWNDVLSFSLCQPVLRHYGMEKAEKSVTESLEDTLDFPHTNLLSLKSILRLCLGVFDPLVPRHSVWLFWSWSVFHAVTLTFCLLCLQWLRKGLSKLFCSMEKEDLKVLNKGEEEEMVLFIFILPQWDSILSDVSDCIMFSSCTF